MPKFFCDECGKEHEGIPPHPFGNAMQIEAFMHCALCLDERPEEISPRDYAQLEVGWTAHGFQVWCKRHEVNVMHVDFEGHTHPACLTRRDS